MSPTPAFKHISSHKRLNGKGAILSRNEFDLSGNDCSVFNSRSMSPSKRSVDRQVLVQVRQYLLRARSSAPIPHQIADNREEGNELHTGGLHTRVCRVADELRVGTTGFNVGEDRVAFCAEGKREESGADVCCDATDDDLGLVRGTDSGPEGFVVPGTARVLEELFSNKQALRCV